MSFTAGYEDAEWFAATVNGTDRPNRTFKIIHRTTTRGMSAMLCVEQIGGRVLRVIGTGSTEEIQRVLACLV
jgi:hypothetical protein